MIPERAVDQASIERGVPHRTDRARIGLAVRTRYDEDFLAELKALLPASDRRWDPTIDGWWVDALHEQAVVGLCVHHFGGVRIISDDGGSDEYVDAHGTTTQERLL